MTAIPATPASAFMAIVATGAAAPAAEELLPEPAAEFVALAACDDALLAIDATCEEREAATDEADDLAEATTLDADADAAEPLEEADAPAPDTEV